MSRTTRRPESQMNLFAGPRRGTESSGPRLDPPPETGLFVTNHLNLMYSLAAGMLIPPSGFGGKHYRDPLADFPGWLPLFVRADKATGEARRCAIRRATEEAAHLRPVLVDVNLAGLEGAVRTVGEAGWTTRSVENGMAASDWLLLVPAPLPACRIRRVLFRSAEERVETEADAEDRSNVPLADLASGVADADWFDGEVGKWPPAEGPEERDATGLEAGRACGGALALLSHLASEGMLPARLRAVAFDPDAEPLDREHILDRLIVEAPSGWFVARPRPKPKPAHKVGQFRHVVGKVAERVREVVQLSLKWGASPTAGDDAGPIRTREALLWRAVDHMIGHRRETSRTVTDSSPPAVQDARRIEEVVLGFLRDATLRLEDDLKDETTALISTLDSLRGGLGGSTVSEMLQLHPSSFSRAVILFFLRRRSVELLDLLRRYPQLTERDRLEAAILFGVRDGWLRLPLELRGSPRFAAAVTHRMATLAHAADNSGFRLGQPPKPTG